MRVPIVSIVFLSAVTSACADGELPLHEKKRLRRPVALAIADSGKQLLVANRDTGTISRIDMATNSLLDEIVVGKKLADLAVLPDGKTILAIDGQQHELVVLRQDGGTIEAIARLRVPHTPVDVAISADGRRCFVTALWSRQLHVVDLNEPRRPRIERTVDLTFSPREQALLDDGRTLIVADAFGGRLAAVDIDAGKVISTRELDGHNIRGLAISPGGQRLLVTHQNLNPNVATSGFNVHWGGVMKNMISEVLIADVLQDSDEPLPVADVEYLGFRDEAAGDPGPLLLGPGGERIVVFAGVSEIAISPNATSIFARTAVGRRPSALALSADGRSVYVANMFGDSVSVVSVKETKVVKEISLGPQPQLDLPPAR